MIKKTTLAMTWGACVLSLAMGAATAETYPQKPIRMVLGFAVGGAADATARLIAQGLSDRLGTSVIVENKTGASGNIAAADVARAAPDGYTLFYTTSSIASAPGLYSSLQYDPIKDFAPVSLVASAPLLFVSNPDFPPKTVQELIDHAKARPGEVLYATSGVGIVLHLAGASFADALGLDMQAVAYRGGAPAMVDVMGGQVPVMFNVIVDTKPAVDAKRLRALAITSAQRFPLMPDVPTMAEATGMEGLEIGAWHGIMVPAGTPESIIDRLNKEINHVLEDEAIRERLLAGGSEALGGSPQHFADYLQAETDRWGGVIKKLGISLE